MHALHHLPWVALAAGLTTSLGIQAADPFAPVGAKATLTVDYLYESIGRKQDKLDLHEWRVRRTVNLVAGLAARAPTPLPSMQALDAQQSAALKGKAAKGQAAATKMAPMVASAEQIMAKCGDDEACMTREAQKLGAAMAGTPQLAQAMSAKGDIEAASQQDAPRYQHWQATGQKGRYEIDETAHIVHADPICMSLPRERCTRDERRQGAGEIPLPPGAAQGPQGAPSFAAFEVDPVKNTLSLVLPTPVLPLPYTETITTDEPAGTRSTPTPRGAQPRLQVFRTGTDGPAKPWLLPLKGGWRSQSGEQVVMLSGAGGEGGRLTIRWRLAAL